MEEIAQVYARSLFEVAKEQGKLDEVREQLGQFADALDDDRELQVFFFSPYFSTAGEEGRAATRRSTAPTERFINFLELLIENHRMPVIFRIRRAFDELWERGEQAAAGAGHVSAVELDESTVKQIGDRIGEQTGQQDRARRRASTRTSSAASSLRVGNSILDASIRNRLEQLRKQVGARPPEEPHHADQARRDHHHPQEPHRGPRRRRRPT